MDKFLIRKPANTSEASTSGEADGSSRRRHRPSQSRLKDLQGVVILEDLEKAKKILSDPTSSDELLEKTLRQLVKKTPGRDILLKTGIGKPVRKLTSHESLSVQAAAKHVFDRWKDHIVRKATLKKQDVRFDLESQRLRAIAKRWFAEALSTTETDENVVALEEEVFIQSRRILTAPYRRSCRQIAHKLRNDVNLQNKLVSKKISVEDFVTKYRSSL